jgi:periplasmic protein CpxP/Spy
MKKLLFVCALLIGTVSLTKAQGGGGRNMGTPEERVERMFSRLPATLNLTADQKAKVSAVYIAQVKTQDSLRTAANGDFQSMRPKFTELTAATDKKILELLTTDQKPVYEAYIKERPTFGGGQRQ